MYKLIQRNQKKFLAVFGVLLMIVFILPSNTKNNLGRGGDLVVGTLNGDKIYGRDLQEAKGDLQTLQHYRFAPLFTLGNGYALEQFTQHDDLYVMLQKEAQQQGAVVAPSEARSVAGQSIRGLENVSKETVDEQIVPAVARFLLVQNAFERAEGSIKVTEPLLKYLLAEDFQQTSVNLVEFRAEEFAKEAPAPTPEQVRERYDRYADLLPQSADLFLGRPATPGYKVPERVKLQYLQLAHDAVVRSVVNELGEGDDLYHLGIEAYNYYKSHPTDSAFQSTPATLPSTAPTTGPTTGPLVAATQPAGPTTKPFEEVKADLRVRLVNDASLSSSDLVNSIRERVTTQENKLRVELHDEWVTAYKEWSATHPDGQALTESAGATASATTGATTSPAFAYPDLEFLQSFADRFEARYKVRPMVTSLAKDWLTRDALEKLDPIAGATHAGVPFATYATQDVVVPGATKVAPAGPSLPADPTTGPTTNGSTTAPTASSGPSSRPTGNGLRLLEPSGVLEDQQHNAYVFRLTAFEPAHKPTLEEAQPQIVKDLKLIAGLEKAREQASEALGLAAKMSAKEKKDQSPGYEGGLPAAAKAFGKPVIHAGPFQAKLAHADLDGTGRFQYMFQPLRGYDPADPVDKIAYLKGIQSLQKKMTPDSRHPSALIELANDPRFLVAEVAANVLPWPAEENYLREIYLSRLANQSLASGSPSLSLEMLRGQTGPTPDSLIAKWFDYNSAVSRLKYVATREKNAKQPSRS